MVAKATVYLNGIEYGSSDAAMGGGRREGRSTISPITPNAKPGERHGQGSVVKYGRPRTERHSRSPSKST